MKYALIVFLLLTSSCGSDAQIVQGPAGASGTSGTSPSPQPTVSPDPFAVVAEIYPCNNTGPNDEVIFQLANGQLIASLSHIFTGSELTPLAPGSYYTSDGEHCHFTVNANGAVTW